MATQIKRILMLVEGSADSRFLSDFLKKEFQFEDDNKIVKKKAKTESHLIKSSSSADTPPIQVLIIQNGGDGGITGEAVLDELQRLCVDQGYFTICFLDADTLDTNKGRTKRLSQIQKHRDTLKQRSEAFKVDELKCFVFPNNEKEEGDLEDLINEVVENPIIKCINKFADCASEGVQGDTEQKEKRKKIFYKAYSKLAEKNLREDIDYTHPSLKSLREIIEYAIEHARIYSPS